jgi:hypothetical protein
LAVNFRKDVADLIATEPSMEEVDDFLAQYDSYMAQSVLLH